MQIFRQIRKEVPGKVMPILSAIDAITDRTLPLQVYTAPSSSPEENAKWLTVLEHVEASGLVSLSHDADDRKARILVLPGLCRELVTFKSTKELLCVFADAADAHQQALDKANILHRDVSPGNIVTTNEGRGLLVDWDVTKHVDDKAKRACQPERTGTFQFLSARFVSTAYNFGPHDRKDDIESFFHTLQWIVLRFVGHGMHPVRLSETLYSIFDATTPGPKGLARCRGRLACLRDSIWACENLKDVLRVLLDLLRKMINSRYLLAEDMDRAKEYYERYRTLRQQLDLDPAQGNPDKLEILDLKRKLAQPAILYEQLENPNWFRERLREAADDDSDQPGMLVCPKVQACAN